MGIVYGRAIAAGGTSFYRYVDSGYVYFVHIFNNNRAFVVLESSLDIDYLIVGGGGGSATTDSGGGGGGGVLMGSMNISRGEFPVIVGAGGRSNASRPQYDLGTKGGDSSFVSMTAFGGGCGTYYTVQPSSGATGGGVAHNCCGLFRAPGIAGQGYRGGLGTWLYGYGGGGGAGGEGQNGTSLKTGDGGIGVASSITGSSVYYGGGGAGGNNGYGNSVTTGVGGLGGGGNRGVRGTDGLGGGAGGNSGIGGSGVVIVRYRTLLPT